MSEVKQDRRFTVDDVQERFASIGFDDARDQLGLVIGNMISPDKMADVHSGEEFVSHVAVTTDAVIAHLYERADDPEVVEAVARSGVADWGEYVPDGPLHTGLREIARKEIVAILTALLGPRPTEQEEE